MLDKLNPPQREAAKYLDGPLLVLAGAGSGKTRVITAKIAYLIQQCGMDARNIAAITFTNKAAREMQERVEHLVEGKAARGLTVSTFHSLGMQILRQESTHLGYKPQFSVLDSARQFQDRFGNHQNHRQGRNPPYPERDFALEKRFRHPRSIVAPSHPRR
jgi:ATP-dependent DNA helicase Rep